jgi:predicted regulator of Ras-like GTPase activity (Roadblock/LC7/MglB family)/DNA-binding Xre family transcriptional regulator
MSQNAYADALKNALTEIRKICPDVSCSFIFARDGMVIAGDPETTDERVEKTLHSFQSIVEKEGMIGGLQALIINGEDGKVHISCIDDMYLALAASKNADATFLQAITHVIVPTVLKLLKNTAPTPLQSEPSKQLVVDTLSGFFVGDSVQVDLELLKEWSELLNRKNIGEIEIESFNGKTTQSVVREINDPKLKGKGIIRIPEKLCKILEVKKGELVRVKPTEET